MAGVRCNVHLHVGAVAQRSLSCVAKVVFHITDPERAVVAFHLGANLAKRFPEEVVQDIQAAAVRHADLQVAHTQARALLAEHVQGRHDALGAFEAESLRGRELGSEKPLKHICVCVPKLDIRCQ